MIRRLPLLMLLVLMSPLLFWQGNKWRRPPLEPTVQVWYGGVVYERQVRESPRPVVVHTVRIDLTDPDIRLFVTPAEPESGRQLRARTTTEFVDDFELQVGLNGSFFRPSYYRTPWDYYPKSGDPIDVIGQSISNGVAVAPAERNWPVLCVNELGQVTIQVDPCPSQAAQAIAGNVIFVANGEPVDLRGRSFPGQRNFFRPHPRTALALDRARTTLWFIAVDGRQPGYSEGVTMPELADIARALGADLALNLDGGGSTTLAREGMLGSVVTNSPVHTAIPLRERPVANHIGVYVKE